MKVQLSLALVTAFGLAGAIICGCTSSHPANAVPTGRATAAEPVQTGAYLGNMAGPWVGADVRPPTFLLGADRGLGRLRWTQWTQTSAYGNGVYSACANATSGCTKYRAAVSLTEVKNHDGKPYFARMKIIGTGHGPLLLVMSSQGFWVDRS